MGRSQGKQPHASIGSRQKSAPRTGAAADSDPGLSEMLEYAIEDEYLARAEYELIMEELKRANGNMSKAAKALGLTNRIMGLRVKKYNIEIKSYKRTKNQTG